jgi:hypothetical protein
MLEERFLLVEKAMRRSHDKVADWRSIDAK